MDPKLILLFIPTFAAISITPGMCMTLAMSLGISQGWRRTLWMMLGELTGVALVAVAAVAGVATTMLNYPAAFKVFCILGGCYLVFLGIKQWRSQEKIVLHNAVDSAGQLGRSTLVAQGFITAIANPKGWAFMVAFLPPFISDQFPIVSQMIALLVVIVSIEFASLMIYATGGGHLSRWLARGQRLHLINKLSGSMLVVIGVWLAVLH